MDSSLLADEEHEEWVHIVSCLHPYGICTIFEVLAGKADGKLASKFAVLFINIIFQLGMTVHVVLLHCTAIAANIIDSRVFLNQFLF
jgi:hypothetical protein